MFVTVPLLVCVNPDLLVYNPRPEIVKSTDLDIQRLVLAKCEVGVKVPSITSGGRDSTVVALNCRISILVEMRFAEVNGIIALVTDEVPLHDIKIED